MKWSDYWINDYLCNYLLPQFFRPLSWNEFSVFSFLSQTQFFSLAIAVSFTSVSLILDFCEGVVMNCESIFEPLVRALILLGSSLNIRSHWEIFERSSGKKRNYLSVSLIVENVEFHALACTILYLNKISWKQHIRVLTC